MQTKTNSCLVPGILLTLCLPAVANAQFAYDIVRLGSLGGSSYATAINNEGQVAGFSYVPANGLPWSGVFHACYYSNGQVYDATPYNTVTAGARAINDQGLMTIETTPNPEIYNVNTQSETYLTGVSGANAKLPGIDQNGNTVISGGGNCYIYHYSTGIIDALPNPSQLSINMEAINNNGELAGVANQVAAYYSNGSFHTIGALPGNFLSDAHALNDNGDIAGESEYGQSSFIDHAFLYHNGQMQDLGTFAPNTSSAAYGINNAGTVVGGSGTQPFVYRNGQLQDLFSLVDPSLGFTQGAATAINNNGWIVGNSNEGAFLAIPRASAVPAPGSLLTCAVGVGVLLLATRRRK